MRAIVDLVRALAGQQRAVSNARAAATELSRQGVERHAVELYLADLDSAVEKDDEGGNAREAGRG